MEEGQVYQSSDQTEYVYDEVFPALPQSATKNAVMIRDNKMRVGSSVITQVFRVPADERRYDHNNSFGEKESVRTCSSIMKETGAVIEIATSKDMSLTFLVTGKSDSVMEARRKILSTFQTQASAKLSIPKEHHRWILGKSGNRLKDLEKSTATKISVPGINDTADEITVTGTREGIDKALHEIQVISDEQSKKAFERIPVPKVYHPFISGAYNENVTNLMSHTGTRIHIPPASAQADDITIAGEKEGVAAAKESILKQMSVLEKYTTVGVEVPKMQHKYVFGPKGTGIAEILQNTGVSVEMPPLDSQKETITLRGPQEKLGSALNMVYGKANSVQADSVDAPSWIHKYIIGRKGANIKQITQDLSKVHVQFTEKEDKITIEGVPEEVEQAKIKLRELTAQMVDKLTFATLQVDPKHYKHIIGRNGANVNRIKNQTCVIINISDADQNTIRIEGDREGVAAAKQELEDMIAKMEQEKEKDVIIDSKYHKFLIGQKGEAIRDTKEKFSQVLITFPPQEEKSDIVKLRGPKDEVDKCHKYLAKKVKEISENAIQIPAYQCNKYIIGKKGATIQKLREETNTTIDLSSENSGSDIITIIGKKEDVEKAKELIVKIQNEQRYNKNNVVSEDVSIPPKMYNSLIGAGGKIIRSITEDCGGVSIKFPSAESNSDKVVLRGNKDDVKKAIKMLLEQVNEHEQNSFIAQVRANPQHHKYLIGKNGANINRIRESTGTRIIFPSDKDDDKEVIVIQGKKEGVEQAKAELLASIVKMDNVKEIDMTVEQRHHKHFVARRCETLHQIEEEFTGVTISFPRTGITSDRVVLKGPPDMIEATRQRILDIVKDLEQRVTINCDIPQQHHGAVMGTRGSKVQNIESQFDVKIKFPDRNRGDDRQHNEGATENGEPLVNGDSAEPNLCDIIRITGKPENCELASKALKDSVPIEYQMEVPAEYHRAIIGQKGQNVRDMMNAFDVHIDVPPNRGDNAEVIDVIVIRGAPAAVEEAKLGILAEMKKIDEMKLKLFKLELKVDPDFHPKIIGRRGANVSKLRDKYGVQINFPRRGDQAEDIITIQGYEGQANAARDEILSMVDEYNQQTKDEFEIDSRVHSRLIGSRGRSIRKIMDEFGVEIHFPRSGAANPNLVTVIGSEDAVFNAKDHLLNLEEEYIQDVAENDLRERPTTTIWGAAGVNAPAEPAGGGNGGGGGGGGKRSEGFVVKGAPWEHREGGGGGGHPPPRGDHPLPPSKSMPDTASTQDFPTFGSSPSAAPAPSWGPRR